MASFLWASCMHSWWKTFLQVAHLAVSSAELSGPPQTRQRVHFRQVQLSNEAEEEIKIKVNNNAILILKLCKSFLTANKYVVRRVRQLATY